MMASMITGKNLPEPRWAMRWTVLISVVLYLALAATAIHLSQQPGSIATLWYSNAVIVVACLYRSRKEVAILLLAGALSNLIVNRYFGTSWQLSTMFMAVNALEMLISVVLLAHYCKPKDSISSPTAFVLVLIFGAFFPIFVCSVIAAYSLVLCGIAGNFTSTFFSWFEGSLIGAISVLPSGIFLTAYGWRTYLRKIREPQVLSALILVLAVSPVAASSLAFPYIYMVTLLTLLAFKGEFAGTSLGVLLCSAEVAFLIATGIFPAPPRTNFYYEALFYIPLLLTLVPPMLVATGLEKVREMTRKLTLERERFRTLYEETPAMMASVDLDGQVIHVSKLLLANLGYAKEEVLTHHVAEFFTQESQERGKAGIFPDFLRDGRVNDVHLQVCKRNAEVIDVAMSAVWEYHGELTPTTVLCVMRDVTEERRLATRMTHLAQHDALTGLPNRVLFQDRVMQLCEQAKREKTCFCLMFIDLDRFKLVNDTLGHSIGDALLQLVAERLSKTVRAADTICRIGGDEFVILISGVCTVHDATEVAAKIMREVASACVISGHALEISLSLGVALFPQDGQDHDTLLRNADTAMYDAKRHGHNRYSFFSDICDKT